MSFELIGVKLIAEDGGFFGTMQKADKAVVSFGDTSEKTFRQMPGLADIAVGAFHKIGVMAVDAFAQAGAAAVGFISDSIGIAGDFESGMNKFAAVAGESLQDAGLELKDFRDQFIQIGKELPVSTAEVQQAAIEMVKGGIEPATIAAGGLKQVIQFAAAADLELEEASIIAAKALGGWVDMAASAQEKADFLAHSTDLLSKAANASTVNVDDLALGLYNVQGTAKLAGVSFDETVTALAQLAPSFSSSADAGTSFKAFLSRLQPSTKPATAAMRELGLMTTNTTKIMEFLTNQGIKPLGDDLDTLGNQFTEFAAAQGWSAKQTQKVWDAFDQSVFYDLQGNFIGMEKASGLLRDATKDLSEAQRVQYLQTIFGQDAIRVAAVLSEQGAEGYNNMAAALAKQNSVSEMAAQKQAGFNTAMDNFKGSVEALQITIGSVLLPVLTTLFNDYLAPGINILTDLAGALFGDADAFNRLSPTMQDVAATLESLWAGIQTGIDIISGMIAAFQSTGDESSMLSGVLNDLSGIWYALVVVVDKAANAYMGIINAVLPIVQSFIEDHGDEIIDVFQNVWNTITDIIDLAMAVIEKIIIPLWNAIAKFITENQDTILRIITNVWNVIRSVIDIALALIQGIVKTALAVLKGDFQGAGEALKVMNERIWEDIKVVIGAVWDTIVVLLEAVWDDIKRKASSAWDGIRTAITNTTDALVELFTGLPDAVSGVGEAIVNAIWDGIRAQWDKLVDWFNNKLEEFKAQLPFSEPKNPRSPLRNLKRSGRSIVEMLQLGIDSAAPLQAPGMASMPASPMAIMAAGSNMATYNNQRSVNLNYHTTYAPPANQSLALASALAG